MALSNILVMKKVVGIVAVSFFSLSLYAQKPDSLKARELDSVTVTSYLREPTIMRLSDVQGTFNFSGKKNEVINVKNLDANIAEKTARQIFAKVPGVFVYDMDGIKIQVRHK